MSLSGSIATVPKLSNAICCPYVLARVSSSHWCKSPQAPEAGSGGARSRESFSVGPACRAGLSPQGEPRAMLSRKRRLRLCISPCPQGEPCVQQVPKCRPRTLARVHTSRGKPRSPPRQGEPTEIRDYTLSCVSCLSWLQKDTGPTCPGDSQSSRLAPSRRVLADGPIAEETPDHSR